MRMQYESRADDETPLRGRHWVGSAVRQSTLWFRRSVVIGSRKSQLIYTTVIVYNKYQNGTNYQCASAKLQSKSLQLLQWPTTSCCAGIRCPLKPTGCKKRRGRMTRSKISVRTRGSVSRRSPPPLSCQPSP